MVEPPAAAAGPTNGASPRGAGFGGPNLGPFVGRARELEALSRCLETAHRGHGGVTLIAGEPGIGKTRLLLELAHRAAAQNWQVLSGRAYESEGMPPYLPFTEALREYVRTCPLEQLLDQLGQGAPEVALLVRELRARLPNLPTSPFLNPEEERYRLFEGVADFLLAIAHENPQGLLLCLDDLHWADKPTLLLLQHLAGKLAGAPLLLVGTYRTVELDRTHPLADVLAELSREHLYQRLLLAALSPEEADAFIAELNGAAAAPAVAEALYRETEGNPFFLEELVHHLRKEGRELADARAVVADWGIPEGVRQVIGKRLSRLSPEANRLLQAGAVLGEGFSFEVIEAMTGAADVGQPRPVSSHASPLLDTLEEALGAGLLREEAGGYHFTHALVRQALYAELSLPRKQRLHLQAAEAIERIHARNLDPFAAELAYHFFQAAPVGVADKAIAYAQRAGERAQAVFAYEEATRFYDMALQALDLTDVGGEARRCDLLLALGDALGPAGEPRRAYEEVAEEAFRLADQLGDRRRAFHSAHMALEAIDRYGSATMESTPVQRRWVERADRSAAPGSAERVYADYVLVQEYNTLGVPRAKYELRQQTLALARELGDAEMCLRAANLLLLPALAGEYQEEKRRLAREVMGWDRAGVRPRTLEETLRACQIIFLAAGERAQADEAWREIEQLATRTRDPRVLLSQLNVASLRALLDGDLEEAAAIGERIVARADELGTPVAGRQYAESVTFRPLLHLGRGGEALAARGERERTAPAGASTAFSGHRRALYLASVGRSAEALADLRQVLAELRSTIGEEQAGAGNLAVLLEVALLVQDREAVEALVPRLDSLIATPYSQLSVVNVARLLGEAAMLHGDRRAGRAHLERALDWATAIRHRPEIALTRLALAELLVEEFKVQSSKFKGEVAEPSPAFSLEPGTLNGAVEHLDFAIAELRAMKMEPALERALGVRAGRLRTRSAYPSGLSEREVEVLRLIAQGKSSRDIGEELVLSVRTVERHIANVYLKTGTHGRAQAATYAIANGLV